MNMVRVTGENVRNIGFGAKVRLNPAYGTGTKYFVSYLHGTNCLIADSKRDCKDEMGYIYSIHDIEAYQQFG